MGLVVFGSIFQNLRNTFGKWGDSRYIPLQGLWKFIHGIITCPMCFSTWAGFVLSILVFSPTNTFYGISENFSWFFDGIISCGAVWAINSIVEWFEENRPNTNL